MNFFNFPIFTVYPIEVEYTHRRREGGGACMAHKKFTNDAYK